MERLAGASRDRPMSNAPFGYDEQNRAVQLTACGGRSSHARSSPPSWWQSPHSGWSQAKQSARKDSKPSGSSAISRRSSTFSIRGAGQNLSEFDDCTARLSLAPHASTRLDPQPVERRSRPLPYVRRDPRRRRARGGVGERAPLAQPRLPTRRHLRHRVLGGGVGRNRRAPLPRGHRLPAFHRRPIACVRDLARAASGSGARCSAGESRWW